MVDARPVAFAESTGLILAGDDAPVGIQNGNDVAVAVAFFAAPRAFKVADRRFPARSGVRAYNLRFSVSKPKSPLLLASSKDFWKAVPDYPGAAFPALVHATRSCAFAPAHSRRLDLGGWQ